MNPAPYKECVDQSARIGSWRCFKAVHRTFDEKNPGEREITLHVSDGETVESYSGPKALKLIDAWTPGPVRFSDVKAADSVLLALHARGAQIMHCHWHRTGIAKGTAPEEIARLLALLPEEQFREFVPDAKIAELRNAVSIRDALLRYHGDAARRLLQIGRNLGTPSRKDVVDESLLTAFGDLDKAPKDFRYTAPNGKAVSWETRIANIAKTIPQCQVFARVACVESMGTAASLIAAINGIERFESVAGLWRFCGQHVIEGKSPKRAKGAASDWSPKAKTVLYLLGVSIQKNNANPWNAVYRQIKEHELSVHAQKHPECKAPLGHCDARARRRMLKEILKRFYLEAKGERYLDHTSSEAHTRPVEEGPQPNNVVQPAKALAAANIDSLDQKVNEARKGIVEEPHAMEKLRPNDPAHALYSHVLSNYLRLDPFAAPANGVSASPAYEMGVSMGTVMRGIYIPEATEEEQKILIEEQENVMRRANRRLIYYKMPLEKLSALFRELVEQAAKELAGVA